MIGYKVLMLMNLCFTVWNKIFQNYMSYGKFISQKKNRTCFVNNVYYDDFKLKVVYMNKEKFIWGQNIVDTFFRSFLSQNLYFVYHYRRSLYDSFEGYRKQSSNASQNYQARVLYNVTKNRDSSLEVTMYASHFDLRPVSFTKPVWCVSSRR